MYIEFENREAIYYIIKIYTKECQEKLLCMKGDGKLDFFKAKISF